MYRAKIKEKHNILFSPTFTDDSFSYILYPPYTTICTISWWLSLGKSNVYLHTNQVNSETRPDGESNFFMLYDHDLPTNPQGKFYMNIRPP